MTRLTLDKITVDHRDRHAYIYIRQSTLKQVHQQHEGRQNQYALVQRALDLGWPPARVRVIDADLGQSGQDSQRPGFQALVAAVSLGRVGIILAYEASRLARNNTDWYTLIDLATVVGTLIADTEGVYDPRQYNDQTASEHCLLQWGMKPTILGHRNSADLNTLPLTHRGAPSASARHGCSSS
jgi:DNA invertase Pin-like site-specific DNA recombinase